MRCRIPGRRETRRPPTTLGVEMQAMMLLGREWHWLRVARDLAIYDGLQKQRYQWMWTARADEQLHLLCYGWLNCPNEEVAICLSGANFVQEAANNTTLPVSAELFSLSSLPPYRIVEKQGRDSRCHHERETEHKVGCKHSICACTLDGCCTCGVVPNTAMLDEANTTSKSSCEQLHEHQ